MGCGNSIPDFLAFLRDTLADEEGITPAGVHTYIGSDDRKLSNRHFHLHPPLVYISIYSIGTTPLKH